ncbi:MAG: PRC-barrel domain-containing protein [Thermaerobacter sp.]|nr:PRC-barrel domain-containing protein [Thermaerobacter sp.]
MVTEWHLHHLPVRFEGHDRPWTVVRHVVVDWPQWKVEGFILRTSPLRVLFVGRDGVRVTVTGLEVRGRDAVVRRTRRWRRERMLASGNWRGMPVFAADGRLLGRLQDLVIDAETMTIARLVVSRGLLGDLMQGALQVPVLRVSEDNGRIKIRRDGQTG